MAADIQNLTTRAAACWVHWRYSEEEWRRFMQAEWANRKSPARSLPKVVFAVFYSVAGSSAGWEAPCAR